MKISSAIFDRSAPDLASCPDESLLEFAFIGRSNVGKSSLLNMLSGKPDLARVSATPGFTKLINIFTMNRTWRLVDLPGYGYAQIARKDKAKFNRAVTNYLQNRPNLGCVFALVDSGLPPQPIDLEFVGWLVDSAIPFVLVFTKMDKVSATKAQTNIEAFKNCISEWCENLPEIFTCSAREATGRKELLGVIEEVMAADRAETGAPSPDDTSKAGRKATAQEARESRHNPARPW